MANPHPKKEYLQPAKKGEVRNPHGRPKGRLSIKTLIDMALDEDVTITYLNAKGETVTKTVTKKQALAYKLIDMALKGEGNLHAIREALDRTEGKAVQPIDNNPNDKPIQHTVTINNYDKLTDTQLQRLAAGEDRNSPASGK